MNISGKCDYACRAMLELASRFDTGMPVASQLIAEQRQIPEKYLTHILLQLKRANLVRSIRGAQGGYMLCDTPANITFNQILEAIDGSIITPARNETSTYRELGPVWKSITNDMTLVLSNYTLEKILEMTTNPNMFHI